MRTLLGGGARVFAAPGVAIGIRDGADSAARLSVVDGRATAWIGHPQAGSSASVDLDGPTLQVACDPFGLQGASLVRAGETLWCASHPALLRDLADESDEIDPRALHGYLCFSYVPTPLTITRGIESLAAGERITCSPHGTRRERLADWHEREPLGLDEERVVVEAGRRLEEAVARRVGAEREVGVFLSGGLDSSLVAALLARLGVTVHLYTLDFGPPFDQDLPYARLVAAHLNRPLHLVAAGPARVRAALEPTAAVLAQPFGDAVTAPLVLLGQAAAGRVSVVFNGEGGDQVFGGWANKPIVAAETYRQAGYDREAAYLETFHRFHGLTDQLYTAPARAALERLAADAGIWVRPSLSGDGFASLLHRLRAANLWLKGAQNIAPRATQLAAAHGLRLQAPFFDRDLTDWSFALEPHWFLRGACEKYLLKRAAEPLLPTEVVWREKRGMGPPVAEWAFGSLRREVARRLDLRRLARDGWFQPEAVSALRRGDELES